MISDISNNDEEDLRLADVDKYCAAVHDYRDTRYNKYLAYKI
jgi:hypothetical protein